MDTAMKRANTGKLTSPPKDGYSAKASAVPASSGTARLAWLTVMAVTPRCRTTSRSISAPIRYMKKIRPSWASVLIVATTSLGNSQWNTAGQARPSRDGPSITPATISPMTAGCPSRRNSIPVR